MRTAPLLLKAAVVVLLFLVGLAGVQARPQTKEWPCVRFGTESGLPSRRVFDVLETESGIVWAMTQSGLAWYNGYYWTRIAEANGLPERRASVIAPAGNDDVFVLVGQDLYRGGRQGFHRILPLHKGLVLSIQNIASYQKHALLMLSEGAIYVYDRDSVITFPLPAALANGRVRNVWTGRDGSVWINSTNQVYHLERGRWFTLMPEPNVWCIVEKLSIGGRGEAIAYINRAGFQVGMWESNGGEQFRLNTAEGKNFIESMDIGRDGKAIVVYVNGRVRMRKGFTWSSLPPLPMELRDITFFRFRENGDLWIGAETGLYLNAHSSNRWSEWVHPGSEDRNTINEIVRAQDGSIWLGRGLGVEQRGPGGTIGEITAINGKELGAVTGVAEDLRGNIWISSGFGFEGSYRWDGSRWKHFGLKEGLGARQIHRIKTDRAGNPWFLGRTNYTSSSGSDDEAPGAFVFADGAFTRWGTQEGLLSNRVYAFCEGENGDKWFGTVSGLSRWRNGEWKHWTVAEGLKLGRVFTLALDHENRLWFGDQNNGLGCIANDSVHYLTVEDGLISDPVWEVKVDSTDCLWIGTRGGLCSYRSGQWSKFGPNSGLSSTRIWPVLPATNKVYVGTTGNGTAILNLDETSQRNPLVLAAEPVVEGSSVSLRWNAFAYWGETAGEEVETRYRIDDGPWSPWSTRREKSIAGLSPGRHAVQFQAMNHFGRFDEEGKVVVFTVPYPLFLQPVFFLPFGILMFGVVILATVSHFRRRKDARALQQSEARYRAVVEDQSDLIFRFKPEGTRTFVNQAYCHYHGRSALELLGENLFAKLSLVERKTVAARLGSTTRKQPVVTDERMSVGPDGIARWHQWTERAIFDELGVVVEYQSVGRDITERKQIQNIIEENEKRYRTLFNLSPVCIMLEDANGIILDINDALRRQFGYMREELLGRHVRMFSRQTEITRVEENIRNILGGATLEHEVTNVRKDGSLCEMELHETMILLPDGRKGILVVAKDISERKRAEQVLKESESRLRQIIDLVPHFIFAKDARGRFILVNQAVAKAYGTTVSDLIGKTDADFNTSEAEVEHFLKDDLAVITGGIPMVIQQEQITDAIGATRLLQTTKIPFTFSGSSLPAVLGVSIDITDRIAMEQAARESEQLYKALVHQSSDPIWVLQNRKLVYVNPAWQEEFGYTVPEGAPVNIDVLHVVAPQSQQAVERFLDDFDMGKDFPTRCEFQGMKKNGVVVDLEVSLAKIEWKGQPSIQGILHDITERKRAEAATRQTQKMESLGVLAGGVAHDFNNLLQAILGHISVALQRISPANPAAENLVKAETAAERAAHLTHQLLSYSGSGKFVVKPLNLNTLIRESQGLFDVALRENVELGLDLMPGLPLIDADSSQLQQVMMNLILNASEAISGRGGLIRMRTGAITLDSNTRNAWESGKILNPGVHVLLEVTDNGSGMDGDTIKKIFDPFFTTKFLGRGLGLSTVLGILKGHHGGYKVDSVSGSGSTFQLLFPVSQHQEEGVPEARDDRTESIQKSILVIDDEVDVLDVVVDMLGEASVPVIVATSGEEGVTVYKERQLEIGLVLLDLSMPGIGGKEAFIAIKQINPSAKIVVSSGYSLREAAEELGGLGMSGFIQKPYRWQSLVDEIRRLV